MATAYIASTAGKLRGINSLLRFDDINGNSTKLFPQKTDQLIISGNIEVTGKALEILAENKIAVSFVKGQNVARLVYEEPKNGFLRHSQHMLVEDSLWVGKTAQSIVIGKIENELNYLRRIRYKIGVEHKITDAIAMIEEIQQRVSSVLDIEEIRGLEGLAARIYFDNLKYNLVCRWTTFNGRSKNPPRDEVNATLSYLYTILTSRISTCVENEGLDGFIGSLHAMTYGRNSLACDLVEEFRTPIVDTLVFAMFNKLILKESCFEFFSTENNQPYVLLNESGRKIVIEQFEKKLDTIVSDYTTFRSLIPKQVHAYKQYILGQNDQYIPFGV